VGEHPSYRPPDEQYPYGRPDNPDKADLAASDPRVEVVAEWLHGKYEHTERPDLLDQDAEELVAVVLSPWLLVEGMKTALMDAIDDARIFAQSRGDEDEAVYYEDLLHTLAELAPQKEEDE
jgi:hypothetical protein